MRKNECSRAAMGKMEEMMNMVEMVEMMGMMRLKALVGKGMKVGKGAIEVMEDIGDTAEVERWVGQCERHNAEQVRLYDAGLEKLARERDDRFWFGFETFDEKGRRHSFGGEPSFSNSRMNGLLLWESHGAGHRECGVCDYNLNNSYRLFKLHGEELHGRLLLW